MDICVCERLAWSHCLMTAEWPQLVERACDLHYVSGGSSAPPTVHVLHAPLHRAALTSTHQYTGRTSYSLYRSSKLYKVNVVNDNIYSQINTVATINKQKQQIGVHTYRLSVNGRLYRRLSETIKGITIPEALDLDYRKLTQFALEYANYQ